MAKKRTWYCFVCRKWLSKVRFGEDPNERICSNCLENKVYEERIKSRGSQEEEEDDDE